MGEAVTTDTQRDWDNLIRAQSTGEPLSDVTAALEHLADAARKLERLARPEKKSETEDFEQACAALARDLLEDLRRIRVRTVKATEEFERILAGKPLEKPAPSLKVIQGGQVDASAE